MTLKNATAVLILGLLAVILAVLLLIVRRGQARNFLDPKAPVFTGPLPAKTVVGARAPLVEGRFSVVSFNIHFGYAATDIAPTLRENGMDSADVLFLQESNERTAREVAAQLGLAYVYYPAAVHPISKDLFGVAILSRWPILAHRKILLPDHSYFDAARKAAVTAVIDLNGVPVQMVSVHLQAGMLRRGYRAQLGSLLACATRGACVGDPRPDVLPSARALLIGGDFNTWYGGLTEELTAAMSGASLVRVGGIFETFSKLTTETAPRSTFDYYFASPGILTGPGRVGTVRTGSDHFPIEATFRIPADESESRRR